MGKSSKESVPLGLEGNTISVAPAFSPAVRRVCLPKRCASLFVAEALRKYENLLEKRNTMRLVLFCSWEHNHEFGRRTEIFEENRISRE